MRYKNLVYVISIVVVVVFTFSESLRLGMHHTVPEAIARHRMLIGVAISDLKYDLKGYRWYDVVNETLINHGMTKSPIILDKYGMTKVEILTDPGILNNAVKMSLNLDVSNSKQGSIYVDDKGWAIYSKLAFKLFGFKIEGLLYLYFIIFSVSVFIYILTFYKRIDLLYILLLFVCSHFVIVSAIPNAGIELQTVHNPRFLPVLAILPSLYLALLVLGKRQFTLLTLSCVFIQSLILIFVIHCRTSALYQLMFLSTAFGIAIMWYWIKKPELGHYVLNRISFWPLGVVFLCFFALKMHMLFSYHHSYKKASSTHVFWHAVYLGLSAHPESWGKYGILLSDENAQEAVDKYANENLGQDVVDVNLETKLYETILKEKFYKIMKTDPVFIVETFLLYKPLLFLKYYCSTVYGAIKHLFHWIMVIILIFSSSIIGKVYLQRWFQYILLIFLALTFSLLPSAFVSPHPVLFSDAALMFTFFIYIVLSGLINYIVQRYFNLIFPSLKPVKS